MRKIVILCLLALVPVAQVDTATGDTANPPKIGSVVQITSGPYKPGDIIVFDVNVTGGNPAIKFVSVNGECLSSYNRWGNSKYLDWKFTDFNSNYYAVNRISAIIQANCVSGLHSLTSIEVIDATDLSASAFGGAFAGISGAFKYEVINGQLIAPGTIRPELKSDSVDLSMIPTTIEFSGSAISIKLPRLSLGGNNLFWTGIPASDAATNCRIRREFPGDSGYSLEITGPGNCNLQVGTSATHFYSATFKELSAKIIDKAAADKAAADKAAADKAAADKAAADKAAAEKLATEQAAVARINLFMQLEQVNSSKFNTAARILDLSKKYPSQKSVLNSYIKTLTSYSQATESNYESMQKAIWQIEYKLDALERSLSNTKITITCIKGKTIKKVTAIKPKCPAGYKTK